jgi:hypothetical protein
MEDPARHLLREARMAGRHAFALGVAVLAALAFPATDCATGVSTPDACTAAGGECVLPTALCAKKGPQDCNPESKPGGGYCCLVPIDQAAGGAPGAASCAAAGGHCVAAGAGPCTLVGGPHDCSPDAPGGSFCCGPVFDGGSCKGTVRASDYDQSCSADTDCVAISANDSCRLCGLGCTNDAIRVSALARYQSDIAQTTAVLSGRRLACAGDCVVNPPPCCIGGKCQVGLQCLRAASMPDAGSD